MTEEFGVRIIKWVIWGLAMAAIMGWVASQRHKSRHFGLPNRLYHPKSILVIGIMCFLLFAGLAALSNMFPNDTATWWTTAIFLAFAAASLLMVIEYYRVRHEFAEDGLHYGKLFGTGGYLRWSELASVRYVHGMKWFRLETASGDVARISAYQAGLPAFAQTLLRNVPVGVVEADTVAILQQTAAGNPPALW